MAQAQDTLHRAIEDSADSNASTALYPLLAPEAKALGYDIVRIAWLEGGRVLQIMAEDPRTRQMTIGDCVRLSQRLSTHLDVLENSPRTATQAKAARVTGAALLPDAEYRLEVSSPGIDRPLTRLADFADWEGHEARLVLKHLWKERKQFRGILAGIDETTGDVAIRLCDAQGVEHAIPFPMIKSAKLILTEALMKATAPLSTEGAEEWERA